MPHGESWRIPYAYSPNGIHTRGTPTSVHTVDFLIWRIHQAQFIAKSTPNARLAFVDSYIYSLFEIHIRINVKIIMGFTIITTEYD